MVALILNAIYRQFIATAFRASSAGGQFDDRGYRGRVSNALTTSGNTELWHPSC
jgi:hypothetical protein